MAALPCPALGECIPLAAILESPDSLAHLRSDLVLVASLACECEGGLIPR